MITPLQNQDCGNLYNDELWTYYEPDRYQKLIEQSRAYYSLEIQKSASEAEEGIVDTKPVNIKEIPQEIELQKEIEKANENNIVTAIEKEPDEKPTQKLQTGPSLGGGT